MYITKTQRKVSEIMEQIRAYFKRLGLPEDLEVTKTYEFLKALQYAHVTTVPYENLDILAGKPLSMKWDDLYDKIVTRHMGGYCFELNGALSYLLKALGFEVENYFGRYLRGEKEIPVRRHRVLAVKTEDGVYMCDTGIGEKAPRLPLLLKEGVIQEQCGETYRFDRDEELGWVLSDLHKGEWRRFFSFTEEKQLDIDFDHASYWCEKHEDSPFNKTYMIAMKTANGRKTLDGLIYKEFTGDELTKLYEAADDAEAKEIMKREFGLGV